MLNSSLLDGHHAVSQTYHDTELYLFLQQRNALETSIETLWAVNSIVLVFVMQIGFAFLESGSVRIINRKSTLLKNFIDVSITIITWVICGSYIARGELGYGRPEEDSVVSGRRLFDVMFACSTATIISGSVTERISIFGYLVIVVVVSGFIYPVVVRWVWTEDGWLHKLGYVDFAGSSVVHAVGGVVGILAAWRLGPRRFGVPEAWALPTKDTPQMGLDSPLEPSSANSQITSASQNGATWSSRRKHKGEKGRSASKQSEKQARVEKLLYVLEERVKFIERSHYGITTSCPITRFSRFERPDLDLKEFQGNSPAFAVIGTLMLWFGFYGFNAGSASISGHSASAVVRVMWNTTIAAVGGHCGALLLCARVRLRPRPKFWFVMDPDIISAMCNATLAGLASICAGSNRESGINSFFTGLVGAMLHSCISFSLRWCGIDDPLDAGAVHFGGGAAGCLVCGLLPQPEIGKLKELTNGAPVFHIQLIGIVTIVSFTALIALPIIEALKRCNLLRVSTAVEDDGFDVWLQQSILPPAAPDVLMQLPTTSAMKNRKLESPWSGIKIKSQDGFNDGFKDKANENGVPDLAHPPTSEQYQTGYNFAKRSDVRETSSSLSITMNVREYLEISNGLTVSDVEGLCVQEMEAARQQELAKSQVDLDYAMYERSVEEQYEKELMAMCGVSNEGDCESTISRDTDKSSEQRGSSWSKMSKHDVSRV
jgi:ammonia channel protein AmtB